MTGMAAMASSSVRAVASSGHVIWRRPTWPRACATPPVSELRNSLTRVEPRYSEFLTFIGVSVDHDTGENYYLDATVAYRRACLNAVEYLKKFGYSGEQPTRASTVA